MGMRTTTWLSKGNASAVFFKRWRRKEDGGMIIFSLFMFVLILWFGGMAVDLMRFETTRAKLQATLDRATLAAADLDRTGTCAEIVSEYFAKAGMSSFLGTVDCDIGVNYRIVGAQAAAEMPLFFYDIPNVFTDPFNPNISTLTVSGASAAEERVTDVEISMVLDVSGSMRSNNRIVNLRPAAKEFVTAVLENNTNSPQGLITISIVPYSAVVSAGDVVAPYLTVDRFHDYSTCLLFDDDAFFETTAFDLSEEFDQVAHFDPSWGTTSGTALPVQEPWCPTGDRNAMMVVSSDELALHTAIDALTPYGNTAIDMGMKWGVALLDPSTNSMISDLSVGANPPVDPIASDRPQDFGEPDVMKVVVLMTDGQNTQQYNINEPYRTGTSFVWYNMQNNPDQIIWERDATASIQIDGWDTPNDYGDDEFYWNRTGGVNDYPDGFADQDDYEDARQAGAWSDTLSSTAFVSVFANNDSSVGPTYDGDNNYVRNASWQEIWANYERYDIPTYLLRDAYNAGHIPWTPSQAGGPSYADAYFNMNQSVVNNSRANDRLSEICAAARAEGVIIYTVAFEAPAAGEAALSDCADSVARTFDVSGTDISSAFSAIATNIRALKLIQ